jgi:ankyrin repeat protein
MPKNKSKRQGAKVATVGADDDFDKMLAEVTAEDSELSADVSSSTATTASSTSNSSSSSSSSRNSRGAGASLRVSENVIVAACERGDIAQLRRWGRQGVRVNNADLLITAIFAEVSLDILRCLVMELGADVNKARLTDGATPTIVAAQLGDVATIQFLVNELGADVNQNGLDGRTPLSVAAQKGNLALVRCLVKDLGADVNQAKDNGATPNQAHGDGTTPLYIAAQMGHLAVVRCLVKELGADVNQGMHDGTTPLHIAAQQGCLDVVRCLVKECGAEINNSRQDGVTPLMFAAKNEHGDVVTFLIKYGANVKDSTNAYGTAADISRKYAAAGKQTEYLEARTHCAKPGCNGAGAKKCASCLKVYYCKRECQLAHWPAHKPVCRQSADKAASKKT